jgi:hypothetical protein
MWNKFTLKKYATIDKLILASYEGEFNSIDDLKKETMGGLDQDENEVEYSYEDQVNGIQEQGVWGFIADDIIHYWKNNNVPMETLIHFFAHEIGHGTGEQDSDDFQEEMRAESYGNVAELAYKYAMQVSQL